MRELLLWPIKSTFKFALQSLQSDGCTLILQLNYLAIDLYIARRWKSECFLCTHICFYAGGSGHWLPSHNVWSAPTRESKGSDHWLVGFRLHHNSTSHKLLAFLWWLVKFWHLPKIALEMIIIGKMCLGSDVKVFNRIWGYCKWCFDSRVLCKRSSQSSPFDSRPHVHGGAGKH